MNLEHAVQTIAKRGFTDRQARFLVLVARHSGVCVMRQYSSFAGIVFGQKTRKFFANLVRLGFVSTYDCAHNRGRVYHVRHRAIYEAIGEPDSRLRRPPGVPRALERLMLLDAILENPESIWMSSSTEKLGYLASRGISADDAPHLSIRQGDQRQVRHFPDRLPIGVHPSGHVVFVYLHADPMHDEFRDFLQRHAPLLERLPAWTIRIVVPAHLEGAVQDLQKVAWGQLASPLKEPILTELRWYFDRSPAHQRRRARLPIGAASNDVDAPSRPTATRFSIDAGGRMASGCWRLLRRRSWGRRWSQEPARSNRWCCRMPTATWRRWRASREGVGCTRRRQLSSPSLRSSASERKQPTSSFSSNTSSSMAYGGPFNQLGSSSIRFVIRSSPSTLSALEISRGPSFTATTTRVPMSVQRNAPACVQNVSPIAKSLSSIVAIRLSRIVTPSPADLIQPGAFRGVFSLPLEASVRGQVSTRGGPRRGNDSQRASSPIDHRDDDGGGARSIVAPPYALVAKPHSCRYLRRCPCLCRPAPFAGRAARRREEGRRRGA